MKSSATPRSTKILRVDMQIWPEWRYAPNAAASTAYSRSASSSTISGFWPPSSSTTRLRCLPAASARRRPVSVEPVKLMRRTCGFATSSSPIAGRLTRRVRDDVEDAGGQAGLREDLAPQQAARRTATPRTASARRCSRTRAARRSTGPRGSARRSTARSRRRRPPAAGHPSPSSRGCRTGSPRRSARTRHPAACRNRPGTKCSWNIAKPNLAPVSRRARRRSRPTALEDVCGLRKMR